MDEDQSLSDQLSSDQVPGQLTDQPTDQVSDQAAERTGVSLREAARRLEIGSVQTVQRWLQQGRLEGKKTPKANGQEKWEVFLPSDPSDIERLRQQLRRPNAPAETTFPGLASVSNVELDQVRAERDQWRSMAEFLQSELVARRELDQMLASALSSAVQSAEQRALPPPSRPWWYWLWPPGWDTDRTR